jgi:hypothetical protein
MTNDKIPLEAILELVTYLEVDEGKHYADMRHFGENTTGHIFHAVAAVSAWLDTQPGMTTPGREQQRWAPLAEAFAAAERDSAKPY